MANKWIDDLEWKSPAKQSRSQKTIDALLDAAEDLFARQGADSTAVTDIAKACGVSVGALYHHFKDKAALKEALAVRGLKRLEELGIPATEPARWEGAKILDILRGFLEFTLQMERANPGFKSGIKETVKANPKLLNHFNELEIELYARVRTLLLTRSDEITHPDPELAIRFILDQQSGLIHMRIDRSVAFDQLADVPDEQFIAETLRSAALYLGIGETVS